MRARGGWGVGAEAGEEACVGSWLAVAPALARDGLLVRYRLFAGLVLSRWRLVRGCTAGGDVQGREASFRHVAVGCRRASHRRGRSPIGGPPVVAGLPLARYVEWRLHRARFAALAHLAEPGRGADREADE